MQGNLKNLENKTHDYIENLEIKILGNLESSQSSLGDPGNIGLEDEIRESLEHVGNRTQDSIENLGHKIQVNLEFPHNNLGDPDKVDLENEIHDDFCT